ncbi:MAG: hypothetical protein HDQ44_02280, partial [Desulfovibrio sp.]|nr:hypothetical protein [Desulfovibrio sp.]
EKQARAQAQALRSALASYDAGRLNDLATKGDILTVRQEIQLDMRQEIKDVRQEIKDVRQEVQDVRQEVRQELRETELRLLKWVIGTIIAQTALIMGVIGIAAAFVLKQL